jgi:hypothetical protein
VAKKPASTANASAPASANAKPAAAGRLAIDPNEILKNLALRLGLPVLGIWLVAAFVGHWGGFLVAGIITALAGGLVYWSMRRLGRSQKVAGILEGADLSSKEGRKAAIEQLDADVKGGDLAATFAKAQLLMQEDPDAALVVLESLDLAKLMPAEADQARTQRAMIHLVKGETDRARPLVDAVDLTRHEDLKTRAMMGVVIAEAWARTGQAKKALKTLDLFTAAQAEMPELLPQVLRAQAFAAAALNDTKAMRKALRALAAENPQYLTGFLMKKVGVHPLLEKEARQMLVQSGAVQRKVQMKYRLARSRSPGPFRGLVSRRRLLPERCPTHRSEIHLGEQLGEADHVGLGEIDLDELADEAPDVGLGEEHGVLCVGLAPRAFDSAHDVTGGGGREREETASSGAGDGAAERVFDDGIEEHHGKPLGSARQPEGDGPTELRTHELR